MGTLNYCDKGDLQNLVQRIQNMEMMDQDLPTGPMVTTSRARRRPALVPTTNFGQTQGPSWVAHINMQPNGEGPAARRRRCGLDMTADLQAPCHVETCGFPFENKETIPKIQFHLTQSNESSNKFTTAAPSQSSSADAIKDFSVRPNIRSSDVKRHPAPQAFEVMKYVVQLIREDRDKRIQEIYSTNVAGDGRETQEKILAVAKYSNACKSEVMAAFAFVHSQKRSSPPPGLSPPFPKFLKDSRGSRLSLSEDMEGPF